MALPAIDIFTATGTWTAQTGVKFVRGTLIGQGGGGAGTRQRKPFQQAISSTNS